MKKTEDKKFVIVCPMCSEITITRKEDDELIIKDGCRCLEKDYFTEAEWFELVYRLWDDFRIIKVPDEISIEGE